MKKVIPIYQPLGSSTHQLTAALGKKLGCKVCHTGTLDPMAEGVVLVLVGDERFSKDKYSDLEKEYMFELALGLTTDSLDLLGLISKKGPFPVESLSPEKVSEILGSFKGDYQQTTPLFSARRVKGKSLFWYGREGVKPDKRPVIKGNIYQIQLERIYSSTLEHLSRTAIKRISRVKGDFRQPEITSQWEKLATTPLPYPLVIIKVRAVVSRGIYIRQLASEIGEKLGYPAVVTSLVRVRNGPYKV